METTFFPRVGTQPDDTNLTNALTKKNQDLSPTANEQTAITNLVTKVQGVLDNLVVAPGDFDKCVSVIFFITNLQFNLLFVRISATG